MSTIADNVADLLLQLPPHVKLVAVSKKQTDKQILEAYACGCRRFGENYVQELIAKAETLPKDIEWHLIGHLQTNKVKLVSSFVHYIHSVDSFKLLKTINKEAEKHKRTIGYLLQVHIAEEETKSGLSEAELFGILESPELRSLPYIRLCGLMGMSTFTENKEQIATEFARLKTLFDLAAAKYPDYELTELSMGMSSDWPLAVSLGSTMIRVGSALFGTRT